MAHTKQIAGKSTKKMTLPSRKKPANTKTAARKSPKYGTAALREIRKLQKSTDNLIKKAPFRRVVREITQDLRPLSDLRIQPAAFEALQEATEWYITSRFDDTNLCAIHAKRVTINPHDAELVNKIDKPRHK